jgi:hypothetical protein
MAALFLRNASSNASSSGVTAMNFRTSSCDLGSLFEVLVLLAEGD